MDDDREAAGREREPLRDADEPGGSGRGSRGTARRRASAAWRRSARLRGRDSRPRPTRPSAGEEPAAPAPATAAPGRLRIAVEIVIKLTRHAETATTSSVSRTPRAKAIKRLRAETAYWIWRPASASAAPNALAITRTIPNATTAPSSAPTSAAARS